MVAFLEGLGPRFFSESLMSRDQIDSRSSLKSGMQNEKGSSLLSLPNKVTIRKKKKKKKLCAMSLCTIKLDLKYTGNVIGLTADK